MHEHFVQLCCWVRRWVRRIAMIVVPTVIMIPALSGTDSFPLSTYPMYAFRRAPTDRFRAVLGENTAGVIRPLPASQVANTQDALIIQSFLAQAIRNGSAQRLCEQVAASADKDIERILVVEDVYNVVDKARGSASVQNRIVHASCAVPR